MASAAYRAGEKLYSERYGETSDYTRKGGVVCSGILLPEHAPKEYTDRQTLWNAVEKNERRRDAQLAYSDEFSFQNEFTLEENMELALRFLNENFVSKGLICDYAVHDPERGPGGTPNPHMHVLIPMRAIEPNGLFGKKQEQVFVLDENGNRIWDEKRGRFKTESRSCNGLDKRGALEELRESWARLCNEKFAEKGLDIQLDNRSYERQGVEMLAQIHEGPAVHAMEKKGIRTCTENHGLILQDAERVETLIRTVNHPNYGWLVDMGNFLCADDNPLRAVPIAAPYAFHAHVKDFIFKSFADDDPGDGWIHTRNGNCIRGTIAGHGIVPIRKCLSILKNAGYKGVVSYEFEGMEENLPALEKALAGPEETTEA